MKKKFGIIIPLLLLTLGFSRVLKSQWIHSSAAIGTSINCFVNNGPKLFAGTLNDAAGVWLSTDHGVSWIPKKSNLYSVSRLLSFGNDLFANAYSPATFQRSTDNGDSWSDFIVNLPTQNFASDFFVSGSNLLASDSMGSVFTSKDSGKSWIMLNNGSLGKGASLLEPNDSFFFAHTDSVLFRSAYNQTSWTPILTHFHISTFTLTGSTIFISTIVNYNQIFLRSKDNGVRWDTINIPGDLLIAGGTNLFTGSLGNSSPISMSSDSGNSWINTGAMGPPSPHRLTALILSSPNLVQGTISGGLWYHPLNGSSTVSAETSGLNSINLFPNPTTGILSISNLSENLINISIFNTIGEKVMEIPKPNGAEFEIDISALPAGMYYARFVLTGEIITRKIIKE